MGDVTEFKPRKPHETYMYCCPECEQCAMALEDDGCVVCLFCGTWTTIAELTDEGFFA